MKKLSIREAMKILEDMKVKIEIPKAAVTQWERNAALDMAIESLRRSEIPNNSDTISKQTAIDAVSRGCQGFGGIFERREKNLSVPSMDRFFDLADLTERREE